MTTSRSSPRPAASWVIRCLGVEPPAPNATMCEDWMLAPALVPADHDAAVSLKALRQLRQTVPDVNGVWSAGRELPFRERWFDLVFTFGVLIHQPDDTLPLMMAEVVRTSRRYVLCGEYFSDDTVEVPYRGQEGALFKRDYGGLYQRLFPELRPVRNGFLSRAEGWDDITWWLFERTG